jgi:gamma-glutamylcyclotransferase (GGCT)/AIG2-like uncharacterized protein YtfP
MSKTVEPNRHHVFVYGTLKRGGPLHAALKANNAEYVCDVQTMSPDHLLGIEVSFPTMTEVAAFTGYYITGELYKVNDSCMATLDHVESEGRLYDRKTIELTDLEWTDTYNAWVYIWAYDPRYIEELEQLYDQWEALEPEVELSPFLTVDRHSNFVSFNQNYRGV